MKYTIELTNKQKTQMDCMMEIVHRYVGFNPKLEPIKTTNVEDTNEYQIGYKTGYDIAQCNAQATKEEWGKAEYNRGYNVAINDYNAMIQWLHDCIDDFKEFMNKKYGYDATYMANPRVDEGVILYVLICDHDIAEVISEFQKWQEEKKKAKEESIKVGDEVVCNCPNEQKVIITAKYDGWVTFMRKDGACYSRAETGVKKTGRHFDEIEQLLSKIKMESEGVND